MVREAILAGTAVSPAGFPKDGLPEIALVGRSNVGKSSLINRLAGRKKLAHTSNTPGRTRTLNFYRVNEEFYLVDLPGYGYARVSKAERRRWGAMVETFLAGREPLVGVVHVVDLRHPPTADDQRMAAWLRPHGLPILVVATKADKIAKTKWEHHRRQVEAVLGPERCVVFSAETGTGREEVWAWIEERLSAGEPGLSPS